jgi:radical SAM superfamily enzyme YgiQ (UPF0313 family)
VNVNAQRTGELFEALSKIGRLPDTEIFGMQIKPNYDRYIPAMAKAGIKMVRLGIESGSLRERASMNKPGFDNELAVALVKALTAHRIRVMTQFIFCYPDQTDEDRQQTLDLIAAFNREGDPAFLEHNWYRFVVYIGKEKYFAEKHGVSSSSPLHWQNQLYTPEKVEALAKEWSQKMPTNGKIWV